MAKKTVILDPKELERLYNEERLGIDAIAERLNSSHSSVWRTMEEYRIVRRDLSDAITKHYRASFSGNLSEKAYMIGFRLGDLWVHMNKPGPGSKTIIVSCHSTVEDQIKLVQMLFEPYGHSSQTSDENGSCQILCYLDTTFEFLLAKEDNIPNWILESEDHFASFLAGYVDAEGSFFISGTGQAAFQLKSCDINMLRQIHHFLAERLGISCPPPRRVQKRGDPTGRGYQLQNDVWAIVIRSKGALYLLGQFLKPHLKHAKRKRDLDTVLENVLNRGIE